MTEAVIVAHGLWWPGPETGLLRRRLADAGFRPYLFSFPTVSGTLAENTRRLARFAESIAGQKVHFVGYSLGGVIAVSLLAHWHPRRMGRIVCLGSPLNGSRVARRASALPLGRRVIGKSLAEHIAHRGLGRWEAPIELGIIAGNRSLGIGRLIETIPAESDGTVAVDETRLPGATAHAMLPVTHTQMLFDRVVAQYTVYFLRHGLFRER